MLKTLALFAGLFAAQALAQYTPAAGHNSPKDAYEARQDAKTGEVVFAPTRELQRDGHGNAKGNQYDLAVDGAFDGQTVLILDQVGNTLVNTRAALKQKGLSSVVMAGGVPELKALRAALKKSCELWLISSSSEQLSAEHIAAIKEFFDAGHGVYLWGDNDPLYADANRVADALLPGLRMEGNLYGDKAVGIAGEKAPLHGVRKGHLITTGLEHLYEGVTIATIQFTAAHGRNAELYDGEGGPTRSPRMPDGFTPLLYGSAGNLVSIAYEKGGKRLVMDGGFTRLAVSWDDAGTARYVKNAASWLVNSERFHETVAVGTTEKALLAQ